MASNMTIKDIPSEKEVVLVEDLVHNKNHKGVIVDLTTMDSMSDSISNHDETIGKSDEGSSLSSSTSSLSNEEIKTEGGSAKNRSIQITTEKRPICIHRTLSSPQLTSQRDSIYAPTSSAFPCSEGAIKTNPFKINKSSSGASNRYFGNGTDENITKLPSPEESQGSKDILLNPYVRRNCAVVVDSAEIEPTLIDRKKARDNNNDQTGKIQQSPTSKFLDEIEATSVKNSTEMKREEMIIIDSQGLGEEIAPEISRSLYAPPIYHEGRPSPILHRFDRHGQPLHSRQSTPVGSLNTLLTPRIVNSLWAQKFDRFNHFQSVMVDTLSRSDKSIVVSAPTGAGKSTIFELAMARFFSVDLKAQEHNAEIPNSTFSSSQISCARKIVYIAPSKALCEERHADWSRKLEQMNLGLEVALVTGQDVGSEQTTTSFSDLIAAHLIVTTPEKWDSMTRRWNESFFLFASVKLLLLDEVHLLGDESRGWCLESIITRMKTIQRAASSLTTTPLEIRASSYTETNPDALKSTFRTVAVSATLPNLLEVAAFLEANDAYSFDDSYRPVPLTKHVNSLGWVGNNEWRFWSNLSEHVPEIIRRFSHGKQALIFCHSKKETQKVAELLIRKNFGKRGVRKIDPPWNKPVEYMLGHGIGYHHAGMSKVERKKVEEAFLNKKIKCLAATSTLAVGVNLPGTLTCFRAYFWSLQAAHVVILPSLCLSLKPI